jgi:tetratricopeptide (TPR) repeat protein
VRRALVGAVAALVAALALTVVGIDALRLDDRVATDDARFTSKPMSEGLWQDDSFLPFSAAQSLLGLESDLAYRRAASLYIRSRPGEPTALNPRRETLRAEATRALTTISKEDDDYRRRSQAAMLLALLILGRGDLFMSNEERLGELRRAIGNLQVAVALDPENAEAKRNLELALSAFGQGDKASGATDAGGTPTPGERAGVGRSGSGY